MKKDKKVRNIEQEAIDNLWGGKYIDGAEATKRQNLCAKKEEKPIIEEKTIDIKADWKSWIIAILILIMICIFIGAKFQDTGLQDNIRIVQDMEKDVKLQRNIIQKAQDQIMSDWATEDTAKKILKEKYNIIYQ